MWRSSCFSLEAKLDWGLDMGHSFFPHGVAGREILCKRRAPLNTSMNAHELSLQAGPKFSVSCPERAKHEKARLNPVLSSRVLPGTDPSEAVCALRGGACSARECLSVIQ